MERQSSALSPASSPLQHHVYTDDLGTEAHGLTLSRQRAQAVSEVLRRYMPRSSFTFKVRGRGESHPAVPNTSEKNRRINRRVVVIYQAR